jgi:hypothetical protein
LTLGELLQARGLLTPNTIAIRNTLHPEDVSDDFPDTKAIVDAGVIGMYDRMQDSAVIADGSRVLSFVALDNGRAKLTAFRTFRLRAGGNVPGDIVYDYDAAHLLHAFIARAATPMFYDAIEIDGLDDLIGALIVQWPEPLAMNVRIADDAGLVMIATST